MSGFKRASVIASLFVLVSVVPSSARAAAALASGAKTSARPTSLNPVIHQMQITFDPGAANLNVQSFQMDVAYDSSKVFLVSNSTKFIDPFTQVSGGVNDPAAGLIKGVAGQAPRPLTVPGDVDLFSMIFQMQPGVPDTTPVNFSFGDISNNPANFVLGIDPNPNITTNDFAYHSPGTGSTQIETISIAVAIIVPEPNVGIVALISLGALMLRRRQSPVAVN